MALRIAVLSSLGIGDVVVMMPFLRKLKEVFPSAKLTIVSRRGGIFEKRSIPYVDEILIIRQPSKLAGFFFSKWDLLFGLGYFHSSSGKLNTVLYRLLLGSVRSERKISLGDLDSTRWQHRNMVELFFEMLRLIDVPVDAEDMALEVPLKINAKRRSIADKLRPTIDESVVVVIHMGAKDGFDTRIWATDRWETLLNRITETYPAQFVFVGSKDDRDATASLTARLDRSCLDFCGEVDLESTAALLEAADLVITTNSGPMWLAAALGKSQVVISGPSKHAWDPWNHKARVVRNLPHRPRCRPPCDASDCYYGDKGCMDSNSVESVFKAVRDSMEEMGYPMLR